MTQKKTKIYKNIKIPKNSKIHTKMQNGAQTLLVRREETVNRGPRQEPPLRVTSYSILWSNHQFTANFILHV